MKIWLNFGASSKSVSAPPRSDMRLGVRIVALGVAVVVVGCDGQSASGSESSKVTSTGPGPNAADIAPTKVDIIELQPSAEPLATIVSRERVRAKNEGRDLLIYVGAEWCEPCKRFHDAAKRGELDEVFPTLRLLELDYDHDKDRLTQAGCMTPKIPLFARPNAEGGCDLNRSMTGSVKGPGAVAHITPRLKRLLSR
jgi:hypothetical protein